MGNNNTNSGLIWAAIIGGIFALLGILLTNYLLHASASTTNQGNSSPSTTVSTQSSGGGCFGGRNYQMPSVLSGNMYFRVEFYTQGNPEYESWLSPGTWNVAAGVNGWVWEFPATCNTNDLKADANAAYNRRHGEGANTGGPLDPSDPRVTSAFTNQ